MTQGLKKYQNPVSKALNKPVELNPYNQQAVKQEYKPIIPLIQKSAQQVTQAVGLPTEVAQIKPKVDLFNKTPSVEKTPVTPLNQATAPKIEVQKVQPTQFKPVEQKSLYGTEPIKKAYDPYAEAKPIESLDPKVQETINKVFTKKGAFGEDGFAYNMERLKNSALTLPQKMVQAVGYLANTADRISSALPFGEVLKGEAVQEMEKKGIETFRETEFVKDRAKDIEAKYGADIGYIPKFTADVLTNSIDNLPALVMAYAGGGLASTAVMFFNAGGQAEKEALESGATEDEAFVYGALSGGIEAGTEMLFDTVGGIKVKNMPKWSISLSERFKEAIQMVSKTPAMKGFISGLLDVAGEGFEEVLAELLGNYAKLVYTDEIKSGKELAVDALYAGLLGMASAGYMRTAQIATMRGLETIANQGNIQKMSYEKSIDLSRKLSERLNYNFELISEEEAITKYGQDEKIKANIIGGNAFVTSQEADGKRGAIVVIDRGSKENALATSVLHEVTHVLEDTQSYRELIGLVKRHYGDPMYEEIVDAYRVLYNEEKDAMYKSGIRIGESEFIAQKIIQEQLFGLNGKMRTSFIQELAGEKPSLFAKLTDNLNEFLQKTKLENLDVNNESDRAMLEYFQYMENLRNIFKEANFEYQMTPSEFTSETETKMQKAIKEALDFNIDTYNVFIEEQELLNTASTSNVLLATTLKPLQRDIIKTFDLSNEDMNRIHETLYEMPSYRLNQPAEIFEIINDEFNGKFDHLKKAKTMKLIDQYESLATYLYQSKQYFQNKKYMDQNEDRIQSVQNIQDILSEEGDRPEFDSKERRLYYARQTALKYMQNNPAVIIGELESKDLIVLHNTTEDKLLKSLALGGFPMPSLAITRAKIPHADFGDITIVFNKDILENSPTFSADAYTPRTPDMAYVFADNKKLDAFAKDMAKYKNLRGYQSFERFISANRNSSFMESSNALDGAFSLWFVEDNEMNNGHVAIKLYEDVTGKTFRKEDFEVDGEFDIDRLREELDKVKGRLMSEYGAVYGFRNDVDMYTNNGRRKMGTLVTEATLENIVKYMRRKSNLVGEESNFDFGLKQRKALLNKVMTSTNDVKSHRHLLQQMDDRKFRNYIGSRDELLVVLLQEVEDVANDYSIQKDQMINLLDDYITRRNDISPEALIKYFEPKGFLISQEINRSESDVADNSELMEGYNELTTYADVLSKILTDIRDLRVSYFESKPRRAVRFEEIETVLIPDDVSQELKDSLTANGLPFVEYKNNFAQSDAFGRLPLIQEMKQFQFQLVPNFTEDDQGSVLSEDALYPLAYSRAVDAEGRIKLSTYNDRKGYFDIRNPLNTNSRSMRYNALDYDTDFFQFSYTDPEVQWYFTNAQEAKEFLTYMNSLGFEYDGISYLEGGELTYLPLNDAQFFPVDSLEYTGHYLKELHQGTGLFEDVEKQKREAKRSANAQIIQSNLEYYQDGYNNFIALDMDADRAYAIYDGFKDIVDSYRRNWDDYEDVKNELFNEFAEGQRKQFANDHKRYLEWLEVNRLLNEADVTPTKDFKGFNQYPFTEYELQMARDKYNIQKLSPYEAQQIIDKTIRNMSNNSRYYDVFEMVDPKTLIKYKDLNRLAKPSFNDNFANILVSIQEKGFIEPVWITANYETGFTYLGEGNHRVQLALMIGLDQIPAVVSRHNYDEPRFINTMYNQVDLSNGGYVNPNKITNNDHMIKPSELSDVFKFQKALSVEQEAFFKDSKVRDEQGNLIPVYHGSDFEFTIPFEDKTKGNYRYGDETVMFFTTNKAIAETYKDTDGGKVYEGYLNATKPFYIEGYGMNWNRIDVENLDESSDLNNYSEEGKKNFKAIFNALDEDAYNKGSYRYTTNDIVNVVLKLKSEGVIDTDAVFFKNVVDAGQNIPEGAKINFMDSNIIAVFGESKFKSLGNLSPTSSQDIRFQTRYTQQLQSELSIYEDEYKIYNELDYADGNDAYNNDIYNFKDIVDDYAEELEITTQKAIEELWGSFRTDSMYALKGSFDKYKEIELKIEEALTISENANAFVSKLPKPIQKRESKKSNSIYLTYNKENYNEIVNLLGDAEIITEYDDLEDTFEVRVSDHIAGMYRDAYTGSVESYDSGDINVILDKNIRFQLSQYGSALTEAERKELDALKAWDDVVGIFETDPKYKQYQRLLQKENELVKYKKLLDIQSYDDITKEYREARKGMDAMTVDYDRKEMNRILSFVKGFRDTDRRSKREWLFIANQYGANYKAKSQDDLLNHALRTWVNLRPNSKDNLNREGKSFVKFTIEEWIHEMAKGAGAGEVTTIDQVAQEPMIAEERLSYEPEGEMERQRKFVSSAYGSVDGESQKTLEQQVASGEFTYLVYSDAFAVNDANSSLSKKGVDVELANLRYKFNNNEIPTKTDIAMLEILIKRYSSERKSAEVVELITMASVFGTELGQAIQALSLIKKLSPSGQLVVMQKTIERLNKKYTTNKNEMNIQIPKEFVEQMMELEGKVGELNQNIAEQSILQETIDDIMGDLYELQSQFDPEIYDKYEALKEQLIQARQSVQQKAMLERRIKQAEEQIAQIGKVDNKELNAQRVDLEQQVASMKQAIRDGERQSAKIESLNKEVTELEAQLPKDILDQIDERKVQIKSIKDKMKQLAKLEKKLKELTSEKVIEDKIEEAKVKIAEQLPVTWVDQLNAWRYLSMLGNPKTHLRNVLGNGLFYPVYMAKDVIGTLTEQAIPKEFRTKAVNALADPELKDFVMNMYIEDMKTIQNSGKYNITFEIEQNRRIFGNSWLEKARNKNFEWLEIGDTTFMKLSYTHALGSIIKARGWDILEMTEDQMKEARKYAIGYAQKATYRDMSNLANALNAMENNFGVVGKFIGQSVLPFKKTPINILKRGIEYSPVSIVIGMKQFAFDIKSGKATPAEAIDSITTGLSGIGIMMLGGILYNMGWLSVGDDDDESNKKKFYDRSLGKQRYAFNIMGGSYTMDWLVPTALPLIVGGEIARAMSEKSDETFMTTFLEASTSILNPIFDLSMLQGLTQVLQSYNDTGVGTTMEIFSTALANYISQLLPTLLGQIARIVDPVQRSTLSSKESPLTKFGEQTLRKLANKVPLLSMVNAPVVDVRGQEVVNYENPIVRSFMQLISPSYYKEGTMTPQDEEIIKMYEKTMDAGVIPRTTPSYFQNNSEYVYMKNDEYSKFAKTLGTISYEKLGTLFEHRGYKRLSEDDKVFIIGKMYDYAYFNAKDQMLKGRKIDFESKEFENMKKAEANGIDVVDYLLVKREFDSIKADKFNSIKDKFIDYLNRSGYSDDKRFFLEVVGGYKVDLFGTSSTGLFK